MSWLSAVTNKAESLLNKFDQAASDVLKQDPDQQPSKWLTQSVVHGEQTQEAPNVSSRLDELKKQADPSSSFVSSPVRQPVVKVNTAQPAAKPQTVAKSTQPKKNTDEALFEFLNSKDSTEGSRKVTPTSSGHHSRQSSTSSVSGNSKAARQPETSTNLVAVVTPQQQPEVPQDKAPEALQPEDRSSRGSPTGSNESADIEALADAMKESPTGSVHSNTEGEAGAPQQHTSSLELENSLLRNEVASLNQEMVVVLKRAKDAETELSKLKDRMTQQGGHVSRMDQMVRELQARESDLLEALGAKDSQLAVLRVRLDEADAALGKSKQEADALRVECNRILQDHSDASGMQSEALDSVKKKLVDVDDSLKREKEAYQRSQLESTERLIRMEQEQKKLADSLTAAERKLADERAKMGDLNNQLKMARSSAEQAKQELNEYKEKASRILQSKEKLISSLREGAGSLGEASAVSSLEFDSLKQERDMLREDYRQAKMAADNLRQEIQELEAQLQQEADTAADQIRSLEDQVVEERRLKEDTEQEVLHQKQELQYSLEERNRQKTTFQTQLRDREGEIEKLRNQLMTKSISSTSESELESRVRALTESLIQKQTVLEALSTEKNSLTLQLERMEQQYRDLQGCVARSSTTVVSVHEDEEVRQRVPGFMREGPSDTEVTRRMKRAASIVDSFSIRMGVFLRRNPIARIFLIIYMLSMHLWVAFILLTYQAEMHGPDYNKQPQPPSM